MNKLLHLLLLRCHNSFVSFLATTHSQVPPAVGVDPICARALPTSPFAIQAPFFLSLSSSAVAIYAESMQLILELGNFEVRASASLWACRCCSEAFTPPCHLLCSAAGNIL